MIRLATFSFLAVVCVSCASVRTENSKASPDAAEYFAWTIGTEWNYRADLLGSQHELVIVLKRLAADGAVEDSTGSRFFHDAIGVRDSKRYLLKNPVIAGTRWENIVSVSSMERYRITDAGKACATPAGAWQDCAWVEAQNPLPDGKILVNNLVFARGIGIVKLATTLKSGDKLIPQGSLELTAFHAVRRSYPGRTLP